MINKIKRNVVFALILTLMCGICNVSVYAATWSGTAASKFTYGNGTESSPYQIRTESEFAYFLNNLNSGITYDGTYFNLMADINVSTGNLSVPTGTFNGVFNGKGHTIISSVPFVNTIGENATVKLLIYRTVDTVDRELLCKTNNGTVDSCSVYGKSEIHSTSTIRTALLCSQNNGTVLNTSVVGSIVGYGDGTDVFLSEAVYQNSGTINNLYSAVKMSGSASGRYSSLTCYACIGTNTGTVKNCYYDNTVTAFSSTLATGMSTDKLKSAAFMGNLNTNNPSLLSDWVADINNVNGGYPIISANEKIEETVSMSYNSNELFVYHAASFSTKFNLSSSRNCTIYYTTDGTNPKTSSTRKTYSKYSVTISGDKTIKAVAYYNGTYGRVCTQIAISMPGGGTEANPYKINSNLGLYAVRFEPDKFYSLETDLDFSNDKYINDVGSEIDGWIPISNFLGTFDGKSHSISEIAGVCGGLFDSNSGTVKNLRLLNHRLCNRNGGTFGSVSNYNSGKILKCYSSINSVDIPISSATDFVIGGIVGNNSGTVSYCYSTGKLEMSSTTDYSYNYIGGIVGAYGTITNCYSDLDITTPYSSHDLGCVVGGIGGPSSKSFDCRFDGSITAKTYDAFVGVGSASFPYNETQSTVRCYNGGFTLSHTGKTHMNNGNDSYKTTTTYLDYFESSFPLFDFYDTWMITSDGPMPQGIMNADGKCLYRVAYTEPTCNAEGKTICKDQYGNSSSEVLKKLSHALNKGVCTRSGCDYKEVYKIDLKYNNEIVTSEFETDKNRTYQFTADVTPSDVPNEKLSWTSSDEKVATVSQNGLVSAVGVGICTITAVASNDVKATLNIKVVETPYLNKIKASDETAIVGSEFTSTISLATDKDANFLYCILNYPSNFKLKNIKTVDFAIVEKEDEYTENGYTTLILNCLYSETENIIKYHTFTPFELTFDISESAVPGKIAIEITDESCLIGNETHNFEERIPGSLEIKPKLAESIEIIGNTEISTTTTYTVNISPDYTTDKGVEWSVDKPEIATVDENGTVTPVTSGTFILTAKTKDGSELSATKTITVVRGVESIEIVGAERVTAPVTYTVNVLPDYATDKAVEWSVDNSEIATINQSGTLTPLTSGIVTITAKAKDGSGVSTSKTITVIKLAETIEISGESSISSPTQYTAVVTPEYTSDKSVIWSVDNESIATVDENGIVTPVTSGTIILTAVAADGSGASNTKTIEIVKYAESIEIVGESEITEKSQYSVVILPEYTTDKNAKWSVSDETVATVDENGIVTPLKNGKIVLTATATDASGVSTTKSIVVTVSVRINSLTSDIGVWDKEFDSDVTDYTIYVPENSTAIYLTPRFENASAKINGSLFSNSVRKKVTLNAEQNTVEVVLTPMSGNILKSNTYTINVIKFEGTKTTVSEDGKEFTIKPINIKSGNTVILALYNGRKFVEMQSAIYNDKDITFTTDKAYTKAKVMVWNNLEEIVPVCDVECI